MCAYVGICVCVCVYVTIKQMLDLLISDEKWFNFSLATAITTTATTTTTTTTTIRQKEIQFWIINVINDGTKPSKKFAKMKINH